VFGVLSLRAGITGDLGLGFRDRGTRDEESSTALRPGSCGCGEVSGFSNTRISPIRAGWWPGAQSPPSAAVLDQLRRDWLARESPYQMTEAVFEAERGAIAVLV
jgi:hypothetical protein